MARASKTAVALVLLCATAACASRIALEDDFSSPEYVGRGLLQRSLDCSKVHPACATCRNQRKAGTRTSELVCSTCQTGWRLRRDGQSKTCDCAPGMYKSSPTTCEACPAGKYCLGGDAVNTASSATDCPAGLETTFAGAKSQQQCFTKAGYGRSAVRGTNGAVELVGTVCPVGTYNVGKNTAGCQKCPAGLTTQNTQTTSNADCLAPAGSYVDKGIGKLCPKGTYSTGLNSAPACTACPTGITTDSEGRTSPGDCKFAMRGFYMVNATAAEACPVNTFNDDSSPLIAGQACPACPNGWKTKLPGADGEALCLAPPGYELKAGAAAISECEPGAYKADWNRNNCTVCGTGLVTAGPASVSKDACLVPAGSGITSLAPLSAAVCVSNTYGQAAARPVSAASRCTTCPPNMFTTDSIDGTTATAGYTNETDCLVKAGWGVTAGGFAEKCAKGTFNEGKNRLPCQACPAGYTTLDDGASSANDCVLQPGWYMQSTVNGTKPSPCDIGTWSAGGSAIDREPTTCTPCDGGFSTQTDESTSVDDCKVCKAGYGGAGCVQCDYNFFSFGGQAEANGCTACATGSVSRRRSTEAAMCYSAMQDTVRDVFSTNGTWATVTASSSATCASACTADADCITYRWHVEGAGSCDLFKQSASGTQELYFKLNNGADYVKYTVSNSITFGASVSTPSAADAAACMAECSKTGDCEVASWSGGVTPVCALRSSELDFEYTGMWAVRGAALVSDAAMAP